MGTRSEVPQPRLARQDHPHAYGDKHGTTCARTRPQGSSPRVWGQGAIAGRGVCAVRIIPTRMGTRTSSVQSAQQVKDHPHAYGDKIKRALCGSPHYGSSPRVWGQAASQNYKDHVPRIIPTRMGTSGCQDLEKIWIGDHPHAYGDKKSRPHTHKIVIGSSPRVWGQAGQKCQKA